MRYFLTNARTQVWLFCYLSALVEPKWLHTQKRMQHDCFVCLLYIMLLTRTLYTLFFTPKHLKTINGQVLVLALPPHQLWRTNSIGSIAGHEHIHSIHIDAVSPQQSQRARTQPLWSAMRRDGDSELWWLLANKVTEVWHNLVLDVLTGDLYW